MGGGGSRAIGRGGVNERDPSKRAMPAIGKEVSGCLISDSTAYMHKQQTKYRFIFINTTVHHE